MRLTLRTLLAYLDQVLEPNEARILQEKIAQGRLARGMVDRIQSVSTRPKLTAPKVDAKGSAGDANVVAEYLDNTLAAQHIVEFEQACLGEDARLAEVACCHQILTMVLARPASVSTALRSRIRRLGNGGQASSPSQPIDFEAEQVGDAATSEAGREPFLEHKAKGKRFRVDAAHGTTAPGSQETAIGNARPLATTGLELDDQLINHVPEYLRSGTSGDWSNAFILCGLIASLFFVAWLSLGSFDDIRNLLHQRTVVADRKAEQQGAMTANVESKPAEVDTIVESTAVPPSAEPSAGNALLEPPPLQESSQGPPVPNKADEPIAIVAPAESSVVLPDPSPDVPSSAATVPEPEKPRVETKASDFASIEWQPETKTSASTPVFACLEVDGQPPRVRRLASGESITAEERIVVPPAYRTEFKLNPGIRWVIADETVMSTSSTTDAKAASVQLRVGRAMVHATPDCHRLLLQTPIRSLNLQMIDASTAIAVELRYKRMIGQSIDQAVTKLNEDPYCFMQPHLSIVCVVGEASIELPNEETLKLEIGQGFEWSSDGPMRAIAVKDIPWWYRTSVQRPIDAEAAEEFTAILNKDAEAESVADRLQKATHSRHSEAAALAMRTLFMMGSYHPCLGTEGMLANSAARPHRGVLLESLYQSLGADAAYLISLKNAVETVDPPRADRILGLMELPDDLQLADGVDRSLIESLSSPFLDERVLAIYQLNAIVGKEHGYQSDRPNNESIQQWKRLLNSGKIRWSKPIQKK